jgi:hypothetical protein
MANAAGAALPYAELTLGALLLAGLWTVPAIAASVCLLALFSVAIIVSLVRGRQIECHCFGQMSRGPISWLTAGRNVGLLTVALGLALQRSDYLTLDGWRSGTALRPTDPAVAGIVPMLLLALSAGLVWVLGVSAWKVAMAVAKAEDGPALGMAERDYLRQWMGLSGGERLAAGEVGVESRR